MKTMKAIVLRQTGGIDQLSYEDVEFPLVHSGEALVKIRASALNHRDLWIVQGLYAKIKVPVILGSDGTGDVVSTCDAQDAGWIGKRIVVHPSFNWGSDPRAQGKDFRILGMPDNGTLAEYLVVPTENMFQAPSYLSDEEAAALPLGGLTAFRAAFVQGQLKPKECVLITGVGGGVAALALQMAVAAGANVFVTSGEENKIRQAVKWGALHGENYRDSEGFKKLSAVAEKHGGIDLIIDSAGGKTFGELVNLVKPGGRIVNFGATAGNPELLDLRKLFWKQIMIQGSTMGTRDDFASMIAFFESHRIKPAVDKVFSFRDFSAAFQRMKQAEQFGKIILKP